MSRKLTNSRNEKITWQDMECGEKPQKKMENGTQTLVDLEYGENHSLMWKMRNAQCRTWSMVKKMKTVENETRTLQIIEYGEKQ